ncbi:hypothetical protein OAC39_00120 [Gammaproteobacteria bacterium]|jgi:hypothetical protein|nr:hypothetical protein [Gammaproteobacteria bacterium]MDB9826219.1 hypothetical protein [Gammaproteobacteria bacterium]
MNNFFYRLQVFFGRLHFMTSLMLIAWELFGQSYSFDTPLSIVSSVFEIETEQAFALLAGLIIASAIFWSYLIGSFVDSNQVALEQQKINEQTAQMYEEKRNRAEHGSLLSILMIGTIFIIIALAMVGSFS